MASADRLQCWPAAAVVLHRDDLAVAQGDDLEQLAAVVGGGAFIPSEPDYHFVRCCRDDLGLCVGVKRLVDLAFAVDSPIEDRPGLVGSMSRRCVAPPQNAAFGAAPFEIVVKQRDERFDVAADRGSVSVAHDV